MRILFLCLSLMLAGPAAMAQEGATLTVTGRGTVEATPDLAVIRIGVARVGADAVEAMDGVSAAMETLMARITGAGVEAADVQTSGLYLQPRFARMDEADSAPRIDGYEAGNGVSVRVRDLSLLGGLLGDLVGDGANRLDSLSFDIADPAPLLVEARKRAVADATVAAEALAEAAGVELFEIVSIADGGGGGGPMPFARGAVMEAAMDVPVAEGSISRSATVTIVWSISQ